MPQQTSDSAGTAGAGDAPPPAAPGVPRLAERAPNLSLALGLLLGFLALQVAALLAMGHPFVCACGYVELWHANPAGPGTSQHLTDWYSFSHVLHGIGFYLLLWMIAPRAPVLLRLAIAVGLEAGWEVVENTPFVIDRYRQTALAEGYFGDSIVNSLGDNVSTIVGFLLARFLPVRASVLIAVGTEAFLAWAIHDNLTLNVIQLLYPLEAISRWQTGG